MMTTLLLVALGTQPVTRLAAGTMELIEVDAARGRFFEGQLAQQLSLQPGFQVTTQADIAGVIGLERQKALLGCTDSSCTAELIGALGVDAIVASSVAHVGSGYTLNIRVIGAKQARPLAVFSGRAADEDALIALIAQASVDVARQLGGTSEPAAVATHMKPLRKGALVPAGAGVVLAGLGGLFFGLSTTQAAKLSSGMTFANATELHAASSTGAWQQGLGVALFITGGLALAAGVVLFVIGGSEPDRAAEPLAVRW